MYSLLLITTMDHFSSLASPSDCTTVTLHPYRLLSPSSKSCTRTLSSDWCVSAVLRWQEEKSEYVRHVFAKTFREASTKLSDILYNFNDNSFTSGLNPVPRHSTSCMLGIPLKSFDVIPENNMKFQSILLDFCLLLNYFEAPKRCVPLTLKPKPAIWHMSTPS